MTCIQGAMMGICYLDSQESGLEPCPTCRPQADSREQHPSTELPLWADAPINCQLPTSPMAGPFCDWHLKAAARMTKAQISDSAGWLRWDICPNGLKSCHLHFLTSFTVGGGKPNATCVSYLAHCYIIPEKRKLLKITLTQPAAGETESNKPTSGQVREVHSFCVSPPIWLLATDAIARSTWRAYARTGATQAEGKEIAGCRSTIAPLPHLV